MREGGDLNDPELPLGWHGQIDYFNAAYFKYTNLALVSQLVHTNCAIVHMMGRLSSQLAPFTLPEWWTCSQAQAPAGGGPGFWDVS